MEVHLIIMETCRPVLFFGVKARDHEHAVAYVIKLALYTPPI